MNWLSLSIFAKRLIYQSTFGMVDRLGGIVGWSNRAGDPLAFTFPDPPCCLVLDVRVRGPSGLDLQARLTQMGVHVPKR
ncbi:hypothetical protein [Cupriavidus necator]|uniref:hypothetical protein n=1 Tax=Cupriavidus necator TaxID=106590 RepID=UPI0039C4C72D